MPFSAGISTLSKSPFISTNRVDECIGELKTIRAVHAPPFYDNRLSYFFRRV